MNAEKIFIIHPASVELAAMVEADAITDIRSFSAEDKAIRAILIIRETIKDAGHLVQANSLTCKNPDLRGDVYVVEGYPVDIVRHFVQAGELVWLMGGYRNDCIAIAEDTFMQSGVSVRLYPEAVID